MTLPNSLLAYQDCTELFDQAIADTRGVRFKVKDHASAMHLQMRLHYCRRLHRDENAVVYSEGDPLFGRSVYDAIVVKLRNVDDEFYVYLERNDTLKGKPEPLSEIMGEFEEIPKPEPKAEIELKPDLKLLVHRRV